MMLCKSLKCLSALLFAFVSAACGGQRIGLFALDQESAPWTEVALAELSSEDGLAFLERERLDAVRKELSLAAVGEEFTLSPALLQNVELFIVVRRRGLTAFDGRTGVRLLDVPVASAEEVARAVRQASAKQSSFESEGLRKVSWLPMLPANLTAEQRERAARLEALLQRGLANRPGVALLERRHLLLLLHEPQAEERQLTRALFAGAVVLKPTAAPDGDGGIRLVLEYYSPDGRKRLGSLEARLRQGQEPAAAAQEILPRLTLPALSREDRVGEARAFIYEAWFAARHALDDNAVSAAASAGALDGGYGEELCRIAATTARRALTRNYLHPAATVRAGLLDLDTALQAARRRRVFPLELRLACQELFRYPPQAFRTSFAGHEELARRLADEAIRLYLQLHVRPREEAPGMGLEARIERLEAESAALYDLGAFAQVDWDITCWERFSLPALERFLTDADRLIAELRQTRRRGGRLQFRTISHSFVHTVPEEPSPAAREVLRRTYARMASSLVLNYAVVGRFGLLKLEMGAPTLRVARNRNRDYAAPLEAFYRDLLRLFEQDELCDRPTTLPSLVQSCIADDPDHLREKLRLQEIALRRFQCHDLLGPHLLYGHEQWTAETARLVAGKLAEWRRLRPPQEKMDAYAKYQDTLERRFRLSPPKPGQKPPLVAELSFRRCLKPLAELPFLWDPVVLGFENGRIYMMANKDHEDDIPHVQLLEINPEDGAVRTLQQYRGELGYATREGQFGAITPKFYLVTEGKKLFAFPRDLNPKLRVVDFSQYCKETCSALAAFNDRAFLSFDGKFDHAGNVIEYNLATQKTRVVASTLDRTVKWPMQGHGHPYPVAPLQVDPRNRRLLMLLHEPNKHPHKMQFMIRLWAYDWENGKWEPRSEILPTLQQDCPQHLDGEGRFWFATHYGFGPVNEKGIWQPLATFEKNRLSARFPPMAMFEGHGRLRFDYSRRLAPAPEYPVFTWDGLHFECMSDRYLLSSEYLFHIPARRFYRLPFQLRVRECRILAGRYLLAWRKDQSDTNQMLLVDLDQCIDAP